jgi:hypothetical protein
MEALGLLDDTLPVRAIDRDFRSECNSGGEENG